jgi:hypothetical protein
LNFEVVDGIVAHNFLRSLELTDAGAAALVLLGIDGVGPQKGQEEDA